MKKTPIIFLLLVCLFSSQRAFAQSVVITPKKIVYKRVVQKGFEHKKTFTITYPKVSGRSANLNRKIENALSYERIFDFKLKEELTDNTWLDELSYETEYNATGILAIALAIEGSGAYPSGWVKHIVVNTKTGLQVKPDNVFLLAKKTRLVNFLDKRLRENNEKAIAEVKADNANDAKELAEMLAEKKFETKDLNNFSINEKGVTFYYDYGFPHIILALEPDGELFVSYVDLKPFIKPNNLLGKFVR